MALEQDGFREDARAGPAQRAEVSGKSNGGKKSSGGRAAAHAERNLVIHAQGKRRRGAAFTREQRAVSVEDEVAVEPGTFGDVAPGCVDGKLRSRSGVDLECEVERDGGGVKGRAEVGRSCRQAQMDRLRAIGHFSEPAERERAAALGSRRFEQPSAGR